ncbi:MAG TPA: phosphatase PAP2 family protein [Caulobacteraceae bacterium]|jgi:undecaprenyl-diphosphatase
MEKGSKRGFARFRSMERPGFVTHLRSVLGAARREVGATAALLVLAGGVWLFTGIAGEMAEGETHAADFAVLNTLREHGRPDDALGPHWVQTAATDLTSLGSTTVLTLIVILVAGLFLVLRRPSGALILLLAAGGGSLISEGLKAVFGRERPPMAYHAVQTLNTSFPSGHATLSAVVFLTLGTVAARLVKRRREKVYVMAASVLIALLVGVTRVYLGVHWASDVLAGWCVGAAWAMACWLMAWGWQRLRRPGATAPPAP